MIKVVGDESQGAREPERPGIFGVNICADPQNGLEGGGQQGLVAESQACTSSTAI